MTEPQPLNTLPQSSDAATYAAPTARSLTAPLPAGVTDSADPRRSGEVGPPAGGRLSHPFADDAPADRAPNNLPHRDGPPSLHPSPGDPSRPGRRYCLITPCRDEQDYANETLRTVAAQSEPPSLWVIVDDGSTDRTPAILAEWQARLPYLRVIRRPDRGERKLGGGVIDAFYEGYAQIDPGEFDYVCKVDLDLELPPTYFADCMDVMAADERLAVFSGKPYFRRNGRPVSEMCGDENAVGMIKFYRVTAFEQIGGFVRELMWDGIDGHRCRMLGWRAESRDEPRMRFIHLRPMGTSHKSWWSGRQRHGRGQFFMGTGTDVHVRQRTLPDDAPAPRRGRAGHVLGLRQEHVQRDAAVRRPGVPSFPAGLPVALLADGQAPGDGARRPRAGRRVPPAGGEVGVTRHDALRRGESLGCKDCARRI